jgi:hypothetical protein
MNISRCECECVCVLCLCLWLWLWLCYSLWKYRSEQEWELVRVCKECKCKCKCKWSEKEVWEEGGARGEGREASAFVYWIGGWIFISQSWIRLPDPEYHIFHPLSSSLFTLYNSTLHFSITLSFSSFQHFHSHHHSSQLNTHHSPSHSPLTTHPHFSLHTSSTFQSPNEGMEHRVTNTLLSRFGVKWSMIWYDAMSKSMSIEWCFMKAIWDKCLNIWNWCCVWNVDKRMINKVMWL